MANRKNVFLSHHSVDEHQIGKLKALLGRKGYEIRNSSIDSTKPNNATSPDYIKSILRPLINWAGTFVCIIGKDTATREWVNWEIKQAHLQGKHIVGVFAHGASDADVPENLNKYGHSLVKWTGDNLINAIEGDTKWCNDDGTSRPNFSGILRSTC
ncbi:TIR domain-containing protein [Hymenobacter actinosclerus]|uniref:MTH538 TIR-like domain n=1 Tax=Hymenobacter actinosclerus TaxID=82805 RepID=A0A1I0J9S6_9BACT|nr:TIR domain-containing protein [Hymenobacter actinosclerus]SEU06631.1 MTH538 TIR-like domain [Hymenobacter actinosclerus]